jgi:hypothetical protein
MMFTVAARSFVLRIIIIIERWEWEHKDLCVIMSLFRIGHERLDNNTTSASRWLHEGSRGAIGHCLGPVAPFVGTDASACWGKPISNPAGDGNKRSPN